MKIDIFGIFGPKTEKMGCAQKWVFFNFALFFDLIKKLSPQMIKVCQKKFPPFKRKKYMFGHFCDFAKITKNGQKSIFYFERWKFFLAHLNHSGDNFFVFYILFDSIKKNRQN